MIAEIRDVPARVVGFTFTGTISDADYREVLIPVAESALKAGHKLRLLIVLGPDFSGFEPEALWDDAAFGMRHFFDFERIACVTDNQTVGTMVRSVGFLVPAMVRVFPTAELETAKAWLAD